MAAQNFNEKQGINNGSAEIAQLVEHWTENPGVPSSILGLGTSKKHLKKGG